MHSESLFLNAAWQNPVPRPPVWLMRQAGRYMKEYRALRERYDFLDLCRIPDLAAEVTLFPVNLLGVDAAIVFSDILLLVDAMGMQVHFGEKGPCFAHACRSIAAVNALSAFDPEESFAFLRETISSVQRELAGSVPLIGFAGGPFTLMSYMVEGRVSRDLRETKLWISANPELAEKLLRFLTNALVDYVNAQIRWGVDAVQIFDTWAGLLSAQDFNRFALPYLVDLLARISRDNVPVILFAKANAAFYEDLLRAKPDVISFDWNVNLARVKSQLGAQVAVQGNLDPYVLYAEPQVIRNSVKTLLDSMCGFQGFICNLGHGVLPDVPFDHVKCLVDAVKEYIAPGR